MILNQSQAEAVYSAMCALNNVGGRAAITFDQDGRSGMYESGNGTIVVFDVNGKMPKDRSEGYGNQAAFAAAYGLQ